MTNDFEITGADQFLRLSKALKHAGQTELRKELHAALRAEAKPLIARTRAEAQTRLPKRGGLAKRVAKAPQKVKVSTGDNPGVSIVAGGRGSGARGANQGQVRHPLFGNRRRWVIQKVRPGWFEDPIRAGAPEIRRGLERALERVADQIVKEAQ